MTSFSFCLYSGERILAWISDKDHLKEHRLIYKRVPQIFEIGSSLRDRHGFTRKFTENLSVFCVPTLNAIFSKSSKFIKKVKHPFLVQPLPNETHLFNFEH